MMRKDTKVEMLNEKHFDENISKVSHDYTTPQALKVWKKHNAI